LNPVPFVYVTENKDAKVENGVLADVAPPVPSSPPGIKALNVPANLLAAALAKNQVPIINEDKRNGANLETIDKPIGDKHNSPIV
jgi:hypothetical protein